MNVRKKIQYGIAVAIALGIVGGGFGFFAIHMQATIQTLRQQVSQQKVRIVDYESALLKQKQDLEANKAFIRMLRKQSADTSYDFSYMKDLIQNASKTVTDIKKLEEADPRLLAKYSKVFFLNEHYVPKELTFIPAQYLAAGKPLQIETRVLPFLTNMLTAMEADKLAPRIVSGYRSFTYQENLKHWNVVTYGEGTANKFVADQGYSEHQLGTTIDMADTRIGSDLLKFDSTAEYTWMKSNAYKYGFVLSYPKNNSYYAFESWHWRFVGVALATKLHEENKYFYDMSQREINTYRLQMFDK